jgi:glycosyltransferase involved in cell wall biosynthesis
MACALPIAASQVGGLPEIIDEGVGALVEPKNPRALANAVVSLLRRPDRQELGREARRRVVANWSISRMVERHLEIYNGLLDEAKEKGSRR